MILIGIMEVDMQRIPDLLALGRALRQVRRAQGMTQEQLAAGSGVGRRFVGELEGGKESCHLGKAMQVFAALGIELHLADRGGEL